MARNFEPLIQSFMADRKVTRLVALKMLKKQGIIPQDTK